MSWTFVDHVHMHRFQGSIQARKPPGLLVPLRPVFYQFGARIPDGIPTFVANTTTAGGMYLTSPPAGRAICLQNLSVIHVEISILMAWVQESNQGTRFRKPGRDNLGSPQLSPRWGSSSSRDAEDYDPRLVPVDGDFGIELATSPQQRILWSKPLPEDESTMKLFLVAAGLDLAKLRAEAVTSDR